VEEHPVLRRSEIEPACFDRCGSESAEEARYQIEELAGAAGRAEAGSGSVRLVSTVDVVYVVYARGGR
jgi:hypothetical protein